MLRKIAAYFTKDNLKKELSGKALRAGGYSFISAVLVIAIAISAVALTSALPSSITQLDLTTNSLYELSEQSRNIIDGLNAEVEIFHLAQTGYEDSLIVNLLNRYKGDKIKITQIDPVVYPAFASQYTNQQIYNNSLIVVSGAKSKYISNTELYNVQYFQDGSQTADFAGEGVITGAINYVSSENLPKIYFLSGHGSSSVGAGFLEGLENDNIENEGVNLITGQAIPEDASALMIFNPETDITAGELAIISEYLSGGGKLILATGYSNTELPNINALMQNYGVSYENSLVMESDANHFIRGYNHYLLPEIAGHTVTAPLIESGYPVIMPEAHAIKPADSLPENVNVTEILTTSAFGYTKTDAFNMTTAEKESGDAEGRFTVGIAAENTQTGAKVVWLSSFLALTDGANQLVGGGNSDLFLNAVNWMCEREESIAIHAKPLTEEPLTVTSGATTLWTIIFVFVLPLLVLGFGIYVFMQRRKR